MILPGLAGILAATAVDTTPTQWTNGGGDNDSLNPLNWTTGVPTKDKPVIMGGVTNDDCITPAELDVGGFDATGYTGQVVNSTSLQDLWLNAYGDVVLNVAMGTPRRIFVDVKNHCVLTSGGFPRVQARNAVFFAGKSLTFADNCRLQNLECTLCGPIDFGANTIEIPNESWAADLQLNSVQSVAFTVGAKLLFSSGSGSNFLCNNGKIAPPVEVAASVGSVLVDEANCASWTQAGGTLGRNGAGVLNVSGNFLVTAGNIVGGSTLAISVTGTALDTAGVTSTVTNADFSGGTRLTALGCTDGGGNTDVDF